jgi:Cu(I)/Ag(I) efflux system membrane fusion protein
MTRAGRGRSGGVVALAIVGAVAAGGWYAHSQHWLAPVENWLGYNQSKGGKKTPAAEQETWTCAMHPEIRQDHPGNCPICGMKLVRVRSEAATSNDSNSAAAMTTQSSVPGHATVMIPSELQQRIGVRTGKVEKGPLLMSVDALGIVEPNETKVARVNIKTEGWVDKLMVNFVGQPVRKGDPLLSIYSPSFLSTQQELLNALRAEGTLPGSGRQGLAEAARLRLELWDVPSDEIDQMVKSGQPEKDLTLRSPISGTVLERKVFEKQYVTPDKELYVVGDLSTVWVQAKVYEYELPHVELGQPATVTIPSLPDRQFTGKVVFIQPTVDEVARTVPVRIELPNEQGIFKPGMFAQISIRHPMGEGLLVPTSAILRTGERDIAYRVEPGDHFVPVAVKISPIQFGERFHVLEGLKNGQQIVTSANFLIDSESRVRMGAGGMAGMPGMEHGGHGAKQPTTKEKPGTEHGGHDGMEMPGMEHSQHEGMQSMPGMDHSKMQQ